MHCDRELDVKGLNCPLPILRAKKTLSGMESGKVLHIIATDPGSKSDMEAWTNKTGNKLLEYQQDGDKHVFFIEKT